MGPVAAAIAVLAVAVAALVAVGYAFGNAALLLPRVPPRSGMDRFLLIVFPAACLLEAGLACLRPHISAVVRFGVGSGLRLAAAAVLGWVLLWGSVHLRGDADWPLLLGWVIASATLWEVLPRQQRQAGMAAALCLTLLATGVLIVIGGWLRGGLSTLPFAVATAGLTWRCKDEGLRGVVLGCGAAAVVGLLSLGHFFGRVSVPQAGFLVGSLACYAALVSARAANGTQGRVQSPS